MAEKRYNENHDENGRFSDADSAGGTPTGDVAGLEAALQKAGDDLGFGRGPMDGNQTIEIEKQVYAPFQDGTANESQFFWNTVTTYKETTRPDREPDYVSRDKFGITSSEYWYTDDGVIRGSGHWGTGVASCDWQLERANGDKVGGDIWGAPDKTEDAYGFSKWSDFVQKTEVAKIDGKEYLTTFRNTVGKEHLRINGKDYKFDKYTYKWVEFDSDKTGRAEFVENFEERGNGMKSKETRFYPFEIRSEQRDGGAVTIEGRPIVYSRTTDICDGMFSESIAPGALDEADLRDVALLINHDTSMVPLARSRRNNANSTMQLMPGVPGLDIRADLDTARNAKASEVASAMERGDIDGMSFMFTVAEGGDEWTDLDTDYPHRTITKISKVFEVSIVTWPAYAATTVGLRDKTALESARGALENARSRQKELESARGLLDLAKAKAIAKMSI